MSQMEIWHMRISRWVPKATNKHSEYVILNAFLLQQWLHEGASLLHLFYFTYLFEKLSLDDQEVSLLLDTEFHQRVKNIVESNSG